MDFFDQSFIRSSANDEDGENPEDPNAPEE